MNLYSNRVEAGEMLADRLQKKTFSRPLILALPRGGVPVASVISERLKIPFDVLIVRKIGYPGHPETGIGAIAEDEKTLMVGPFHHSDPRLLDVIVEEKAEVRRRIDAYRKGKPLPDLKNKEIILVDDGLATGVTAIAAAKYLKEHGVRRILLAVPVAPPTDDKYLQKYVDEIICPHRPINFSSVGAWYDNFDEVNDEEVNDYLETRHFQNLDPSI
jgi:putative phosphoribosyl transferase